MKYSLLASEQNGFLRRFIINVFQIVFSSVIVIIIVDTIGYYKCQNYNENDTSIRDIIGFKNIGFNSSVKTNQEIDDNSAINKFRNCSNEAYAITSDVKSFVKEYRECLKSNIPEMNFEQFHMGRFGEVKVFLPMKDDYLRDGDCNWLTVGIGGDSLVEKEFKEKYPRCNIYGVEASSDQYVDFANYGTIIPYGVGVINGSFELTVREGTKYLKKEVQVLSMANLLDEYVKTRHIEYMTIDIEGFEYNILEQLINGRKLANQNIVFCQIDAELHELPQVKGKVRDFLNLFNDNNSDYIPVYNAQFLKHQKVTFVNFKDPNCRRAFDISSLL